ncbi:MAG: DoxX family protein [Anaerolineae bacterium]|jgi:putative oxidoreductase|nr:DoxX family protein [Anaerolineae bacterium]
MRAASSFLGRALLALIFILAGLDKIQGSAATAAYMAQFGVPAVLLPATIALEIGGGLAVLAGLYSRLAAVLLALFTLATGLIFHSNFTDNIQFALFLKNLAITGGFLLLFAHGPGAWALNDK